MNSDSANAESSVNTPMDVPTIVNMDITESIPLQSSSSAPEPNSSTTLVEDKQHVPISKSISTSSLEEKPIYFPRKKIKIRNSQFSIILQSINGPCPLVAITNVLLLRGSDLPGLNPNTSTPVTDFELVQILANYCLNLKQRLKQDFEGQIEQVIELLPKMRRGLDVNTKFTSVRGFEVEPEMAIFKLLDLILLHGWVVDPQDVETASAFGELTYNQAIEKVVLMNELLSVTSSQLPPQQLENLENNVSISQISQPKELLLLNEEQKKIILSQGQSIQHFLDDNPTQLTYYGLEQIHNELKENQLAVFFRNNHFATIVKNEGQLYLLCTDEAYIHEPNVIWERLGDVTGDSEYYNGSFQVVRNQNLSMNQIREAQQKEASKLAKEQEDADFQFAMQLQQQEKRQQQQQQQMPPQQYLSPYADSHVNNNNTSASSSPNLVDSSQQNVNTVPTIRQQKEMLSQQRPSNNNKPSNDRYANQAAKLRDLNNERNQRNSPQIQPQVYQYPPQYQQQEQDRIYARQQQQKEIQRYEEKQRKRDEFCIIC